MIKLNYKKATYLMNIKIFLKFYLNNEWKSLSELNQFLIINIVKRFLNNNKTKLEKSEKYNLKSAKDKRLIELLKNQKQPTTTLVQQQKIILKIAHLKIAKSKFIG